MWKRNTKEINKIFIKETFLCQKIKKTFFLMSKPVAQKEIAKNYNEIVLTNK